MNVRAIRFLSLFVFLYALLLDGAATGSARPTQPLRPDPPDAQVQQAAFKIAGQGESSPHPGDPGRGATHPIASPYEWHTFYGSSEPDSGSGIAVAEDGSVYITGQSESSWRGDGGANPLHPYSSGSDLFVVKLNSGGAYQWHTFYGSSDLDFGSGIAVAPDGSVYITGHSDNSWLGDGGAEPLHPHSGGGDLVVVKLDSNGAYQWHTFYGSGGFDSGLGIAIAGDGSVYVTEQSYASWLGDSGEEPLNPYDEAFNLGVVKLDSRGAFQWHTFYGSSDLDFAKGISVAGDGDVYITGYSQASWLGDGGAEPLHPHSGGFDLVVLKLDSHGAYQWHTFYGSGDYDYGVGIAIAGDGFVYITGFNYSSWLGEGGKEPLHPYSGDSDLVVLKLDSLGAYQWHTFYGSNDSDFGSGIAIDLDGNLYVTGRSSLSWLGDAGEEALHPFSGVSDIFVLKLANSGAYQWHTFYGSSEDDSGEGIASAGDGSTYVSGWSQLSWVGDDKKKPLHPHSGSSDLVVMKLREKIWYYLPLVHGHGY